jgi:hypothetical protein
MTKANLKNCRKCNLSAPVGYLSRREYCAECENLDYSKELRKTIDREAALQRVVRIAKSHQPEGEKW